MAKEFSSRQTQFEQWDASDPNRKMALEETPWLQMAKGGDANASDLINVLDARIAKAQREGALAKLRQSQTSSGGYPWFAGGPPSPYMTLYILYGFSKALEFGVDVPREMVRPAWDYMHRHYLDEIVHDMMSNDAGWEFVTFINYVLSNYPDSSWYENTFTPAERKTMLDFSFKHWRGHSPYLKGYLALTLKRMDRPKDAMLVWESVMDSAKTAEDQGTFWAPEDRSWLWYNDTIETHAFAIRTDMELIPAGPETRRHGALGFSEQETEPLEIHPRHRRSDLLAGALPETNRPAWSARGCDRDGRKSENKFRIRAGSIHGQEEPDRHSRRKDRPQIHVIHHGGEDEQRISFSLGHVALFHRTASRGGARRLPAPDPHVISSG